MTCDVCLGIACDIANPPFQAGSDSKKTPSSLSCVYVCAHARVCMRACVFDLSVCACVPSSYLNSFSFLQEYLSVDAKMDLCSYPHVPVSQRCVRPCVHLSHPHRCSLLQVLTPIDVGMYPQVVTCLSDDFACVRLRALELACALVAAHQDVVLSSGHVAAPAGLRDSVKICDDCFMQVRCAVSAFCLFVCVTEREVQGQGEKRAR